LLAPEHGGHCAFISQEDGPERFWAEARIVEFCRSKSELARTRAAQPLSEPKYARG
jgi:predicted alpha/beta-fold hydrolase